jgi:integrase
MRMSYETIKKIWRRYAMLVGVEGAGMHAARATLITKLLTDGVDYRGVQEVSRHSSTRMVEVYDKRRYEIEEQANRKVIF